MSIFRRIQIVEEEPIPSLCLIETFHKTLLGFPPSPLFPDLDFDLDLFHPVPSPFHLLTHIHRTKYAPPPSRLSGSDLYHLHTLSEKVSALESAVNRLVIANAKPVKKTPAAGNYSLTAEINSDGIERKYQWTAKIKGGEKKQGVTKSKNKVNVKNYKWTSEIKGRGEHAPVQKYTVEVTPKEKKDKKEKKEKESPRTVEIEEITNPGGLVLRQVFAKRAGAVNAKGKRKELSPQDAAIMIQNSFRAYLIRRSKALRGLRELAVAKNKLKELRKLFNNFSYRRRIAHDAEECQKFTERIIVVLLTVDAIEGVDVMVRAAKRSMVDELEAMLDVVDPHPAGDRSLSIRRRTFDLPTGGIQKEIAAGVAQVVRMLNEEENGTEDSTFEACL
ncbi:unnamed protein product [Rhodiola kirilowii]